MSDPALARLWAAVERMRAASRGGERAFREAGPEYSELLSAIAATRDYPVAVLAEETGLSPRMIRSLRRSA